MSVSSEFNKGLSTAFKSEMPKITGMRALGTGGWEGP